MGLSLIRFPVTHISGPHGSSCNIPVCSYICMYVPTNYICCRAQLLRYICARGEYVFHTCKQS